MNHPRSLPSTAPTPALAPEEQREVDHLRAQFYAMGMTDEDIARMAEPTAVTLAEELAFLDGQGPDPDPCGS